MNKLLLFFLALLFTGSVIGQQSTGCKKTCCSKGKPTLATLDKNMQVIFVVDSSNYKIEDLTKYELDPEWVENISILKDAKSKEIWNNDHGIAFLYIKEEYDKKVIRQIKKHE